VATEDIIVQLKPSDVDRFIGQIRELASQPPGASQLVMTGNRYRGDETEPVRGVVIVRIIPND
jgi:hypothetical protein